MIPYFLLFGFAWLTFAANPNAIKRGQRDSQGAMWLVACLGLTIMIGLRYEVGGDWETYLDGFRAAQRHSLAEVMAAHQSEAGYLFLNWLGNQGFGGIYFVNTACALIFTSGLVVFCREQPRPWLALVVAIPYFVIVVAMGYTRQAVAIGLVMVGLVALQRGQTYRFILNILLAVLFHKTAVIMLGLLLFSRRIDWRFKILGLPVLAGLSFRAFLADSIDTYTQGYIEQQYASSGAAIRIAINAIPALFLIIFRRRILALYVVDTFWFWLAWISLAFIFLLGASASSTAVDRLALYLIPLQLFVFARLPDALGQYGARNTAIANAIIFYHLAIQLVWLNFAATAFAWVPYTFYPWFALTH